MANKLKFEQLNKRRHGLEHPAKNRVSPARDAEEWAAGEQTRPVGTQLDRQLLSILKELLAQARTTTFFALPEGARVPVVRKIKNLHASLQLSQTINGYVGGTEYRQAKRLLEMHGPLPLPKRRFVRRIPPGA